MAVYKFFVEKVVYKQLKNIPEREILTVTVIEAGNRKEIYE